MKEMKAMTVRISAEQAAELQAVAEVQGAPISEEIREAIAAHIETRKQDKVFQSRLIASLERHKEILEKLAR